MTTQYGVEKTNPYADLDADYQTELDDIDAEYQGYAEDIDSQYESESHDIDVHRRGIEAVWATTKQTKQNIQSYQRINAEFEADEASLDTWYDESYTAIDDYRNQRKSALDEWYNQGKQDVDEYQAILDTWEQGDIDSMNQAVEQMDAYIANHPDLEPEALTGLQQQRDEMAATIGGYATAEEDLGEPSEKSIAGLIDQYGFTHRRASVALGQLGYVGYNYKGQPITSEEELISIIDQLSKAGLQPYEITWELEGIPGGPYPIPDEERKNFTQWIFTDATEERIQELVEHHGFMEDEAINALNFAYYKGFSYNGQSVSGEEEIMNLIRQLDSEGLAAHEIVYGFEEAAYGYSPGTEKGAQKPQRFGDVGTAWDDLQSALSTAEDPLGLIDTFIQDYGDQLVPEDLTAIQGQRDQIATGIQTAETAQAEWTDFQNTVTTAIEGADYPTALSSIDDYIASHPDLPEETLTQLDGMRAEIQRVTQISSDWDAMTTDVNTALQSGDFDAAVSAIDAFAEAHPDVAEQAQSDLQQMRTDIEDMRGQAQQAEKPLSEYTPEELNTFIDNLPDTPPAETGAGTWYELLGIPPTLPTMQPVDWRWYLKQYPGLLTVDEATLGHIRAIGEEIEKLAAVDPGKQGTNLEQWQEARKQIRDVYIPVLERAGLPVPQDILTLLDKLDYECRDMSTGDIIAYGSKNMRAEGFWNPQYSPFGAALAMLQETTMGWGYVLQGITTLWPGGAPAKAPWDWVPESYENYEEDVPSLLRTIAEWTNPVYFMPIIPAAAGGPLAGRIGAAVAAIPRVGEYAAPVVTRAITGFEAAVTKLIAPVKQVVGKGIKPVIKKFAREEAGTFRLIPKAETIAKYGEEGFKALMPEEQFALSEPVIEIALDKHIQSATKIATEWYGKFAQRLPTKLQRVAQVVHPATLLKEPTQAMLESEPARYNSLVLRRSLLGGNSMTGTLKGFQRVSMSYIETVEQKTGGNLQKLTAYGDDLVVKRAVTAAPGYEGKVSMAVGDILDDVARGGSKYIIDDTVRPVFDAYVNVINKWKAVARQAGLDLGDGYFPRRVIGGPSEPISEEFGRVINRKLGSLSPSEKERVFETQMGGIEAGFKYLPPDRVLPLFQDEMTQRIVSEAVAAQLKKDLPTKIAQAAFDNQMIADAWKLAQSQRKRLAKVDGMVAAWGRKKPITESQIKLIESISPELGASVREASTGLARAEAKLRAGAYMGLEEFEIVAANRGYKIISVAKDSSLGKEGYMFKLVKEGKPTLYAQSYKEMGDILRSFEVGEVAKETVAEGGLPDVFLKATEADIQRMEQQIVDQRLAVERARISYEQTVPPEAKLKIPKTGKEELDTLVDMSVVTPDIVEAAQRLRDELRILVDLQDGISGLKKFLAEAKAYKVPAATPEVAKVTPKPIAAQRATLWEVKNELKQLRKEWAPQYAKARQDWAQAVKATRKGTYEMVNIPEHPALRGVQFPREIAMELRQRIGGEQTSWFLKNASNLASVLRMSKAALDLSAPMIQGLPLIFMGPKGTAAWIEATGRSFYAMARPGSRARFIMEHWESAIALANHRGYLGTFEFYEAFPGIVKRLEGVPGGKYPKFFLEQTFGRAEASFGAFGDSARILMWEAMVPTVEARIGKRFAQDMFGKSWEQCSEAEAGKLLAKYSGELEAELFELATSLNLMTGVLSSAGLGIGATQRSVEAAFIFFAPRYTRACLGLMANVLRGGLTGRMAQESLGSMMAGGMALYVGTCYALGQTPNLDPRKSNFMCIRVGNRWIGPGGTFTQALRMQAKIITKAWTGITKKEGQQFIDLVSLIKLEDHKPVLNRWDNPLMYFLFNKTSQLTSMTNLMLVENSDFFGDPFESPADYARFVGEEFIPIWIESSFLELPGYGFSPAVMAGEILGLRTPPLRPWELRNEYRETYAEHDYGRSWINLMPSEQEALENKYPELDKWTSLSREDWATWRDSNAEIWDEWDDRKTRAYDNAMNKLKMAEDEFINCLETGNEGCGAVFRDKTSDIWNAYGDEMDLLEGDPKYAPIYELFAEPIDPDITYATKIAYYEYLDLIYDNPALEDQYGNYLSDVREKLEADFLEKWGPEIYDAVQQELGYGREYPVAYTELQKARDVLDPYWDIQDDISANYEAMGYVLDSDAETEQSLNAALQWLRDEGAVDYDIADGYAEDAFQRDWADITDEQRAQLIAEHPEIEDAYYYEQIVTGAIENPATVTKQTRDQYAQEAFGKNWSDLSDAERKYLRTMNPEIEQVEEADNRYNRIVSDTVDIRQEMGQQVTTVAEAINAAQQEWREQNTEGDYYLWLYYDRNPLYEQWQYEAPEWAGGAGYAPQPVPPEEVKPPETELTLERIVGDFRTAEPETQLELVELALDTYGPEEVRAAFTPEEIAPYEWNIRAIEIKDQWKYEFKEYATLKTTEEREQYLESHPEFRDDRLRVQAVDYGVPGQYVEDYVEFRNVPTAGYANEAWLANHIDFYEDVWIGILENEPLPKSMEYYQIRGQWLNEFAEYSDLETTAERRDYLESHPEFRDDRRRLEAMDKDVPEQYIEDYVEYWALPSTGYGQELWLLQHGDFYEDVWLGVLEKDPLYRPDKYYELWGKWQAEFAEYDALEERGDREEYLAAHPDFADDRRRMEAMEYEIPEKYVESYVEYYHQPSAGYANEVWLSQHAGYYQDVWLGILGNEPLAQSADYYNIAANWLTEFDEYDALETTDEREAYLEGHPEFRDDRRRLTGMDYGIPDNYIEQYVEYSNIPSAGYANERWLKEHPDYYEDIWLGVLGNQEKDFSKVPTEKFENAYNNEYKALPVGKQRMQYRCSHHWFDDEGVELGYWKPADCT